MSGRRERKSRCISTIEYSDSTGFVPTLGMTRSHHHVRSRGVAEKKSRMRVVVLTDHETHGPGESIYMLLRRMSAHPQCESLLVASRGRGENADFFADDGGCRVLAREMDDDFAYHEDGQWFHGGSASVDVRDFDVLFLRVDRPVSDSYLDSLTARCANQLIINDPKGIQETGSKRFLLRFSSLCPAMRLCHTVGEVEAAAREYAIVLKPLHGYGGKGMLRIDGAHAWNGNLETTFEAVRPTIEARLSQDAPMLAVKFLPNIRLGDKRIVVVNGQVLGAMLRIPRAGSWLANLSQGATTRFAEIDPEEREIVEIISPSILDRGVVIFGLDTLVDDGGRRVLSEINTLNVGGFLQAEEHSGQPIVERAGALIWEYLLSSKRGR